jgi:hypothetical protein
MPLCQNKNCLAKLKTFEVGASDNQTTHPNHWGGRFCSRACMISAEGYDPETDRPLLDPDDPNFEICRTLDEIDWMLDSAFIDKRLPRMIYLRKRRWTEARIGRDVGMSQSQVHKLLVRAYAGISKSARELHKKFC